MPIDLRPLTLGELLDRSFSLYRRHFWLFVGVMAVPSVLALLFGMVLIVLATSSAGLARAPAQQDPTLMIGAVVGIFAGVIGMSIIYFITYAVALGATTVAVSRIYMDKPVSIRAAYEPLRGLVGRMALLLFLISVRLFGVLMIAMVIVLVAGAVTAVAAPVLGGLMAFGGVLVAFLLSVWVALRYAVAVPAAVLEDQTATDSIQRSVDLTRGSLGRVFVLLFFTMVITYAVLGIFQGPFEIAKYVAGPESATAFWFELGGVVMGSIGGALTAPLMIVAFAVLYYDLRVRKEGLDLEMMIASLDVTSKSELDPQSSVIQPG
jgi:hypothetical protein